MNNSKNENQYRHFLNSLKKTPYSGEIHADLSERLQHAADNSIYIEIPNAILTVKSTDDIKSILELLSTDPYRQLKISCRGGGTSAVGQSLNSGLVINTRRYLNNIIKISKEKKEVKVQPGLTLEKLNQALDEIGLYFAVQISSATAATIGGMVNTNAVGSGGLIHGRMDKHIKSLKIINHQGKEIELCDFDQNKVGQSYEDEKVQTLLSNMKSDILTHKEKIDAELNSTSRPLSGYHLSNWINDEGRCHPSSLFCGSEGTLGIITEVTLKLSEKPKFNTLTVVAFNDLCSPLDNANQYLNFKPSEIELLDKNLLTAIGQQTIAKEIFSQYPNIFNTSTASLHYVQWQGDKEDCLNNQQLYTEFIQQHSNYISHININNKEIQEQFWSLRKKAVGFIGKMTDGDRRTVPGLEDTVVPQDKLGSYLRQVNHIMQENNILYSIYGHIDAGCIHIRPALDLSNEEDKSLYQTILNQIFKAAKDHGGIFRGGEHGFGKLSQFNSQQLSSELFQLMVKIKHYWDPDNRFGNGNIISTSAETEHLAERYKKARNNLPNTEQQFMHCNGNASCLNNNKNLLICPSYKATQELRHSPRGRSILLKEWYQRKADKTLKSQFTKEVKQALDGCLSCKACVSQCPLNVSIPEAKSHFLNNSNLSKTTSLIEKVTVFSENHPKIANILHKISPEKITAKVLGLSTLPYKSKSHYRKLISQHYNVQNNKHYDTIIIPDLFSLFYQPEIIQAAIMICRNLNISIAIDNYHSAGLSHYNLGQFRQFDAKASILSKRIKTLQQQSTHLVCLEPTVRLALNHEYLQRKHLSNKDQVRDFSDFLLEYLQQNQPELNNSLSANENIVLFPHCHESSLEGNQHHPWNILFSWLGAKSTVIQTGCCGMAGSYGLERKNTSTAKWLFEQHWKDHLNKEPNKIILATGYSCRSQAKLQHKSGIQHPIEYLNHVLQLQKEKNNETR